LKSLGGVLERHRLDVVVLLLQEIEVMADAELGLLRVVAVDSQAELAPSLVLAGERRLREG
jgi:hypothetical protein